MLTDSCHLILKVMPLSVNSLEKSVGQDQFPDQCLRIGCLRQLRRIGPGKRRSTPDPHKLSTVPHDEWPTYHFSMFASYLTATAFSQFAQGGTSAATPLIFDECGHLDTNLVIA